MSVENLKNNFEKVYVNSVVQCAGNRRNDMNNFKKVQGLMWTGTAISNAKWAGCRMRVKIFFLSFFIFIKFLVFFFFRMF